MAKTQDLARVRAVLETDREWAAFALADLTPPHLPYSQWHLADDTPALVLIYRGYHPPLFFALGRAEAVMQLAAEAASENEMYVSLRDGVLQQLADSGYRVLEEKAMYRMVLDPRALPFLPHNPSQRLGAHNYDQLATLFADGDSTGESPGFFKQSSIADGIYFGVREEGQLIAAAGTHVFALEESVAGLGNVYTRRDRRGRGLGPLVTSAVAAELVRLGIRTVVLNVAERNRAAIRVYERLGFAHYCDYREALIVRNTAVRKY
jgi:RimJ/RimL family protein N-acetyltransferase